MELRGTQGQSAVVQRVHRPLGIGPGKQMLNLATDTGRHHLAGTAQPGMRTGNRVRLQHTPQVQQDQLVLRSRDGHPEAADAASEQPILQRQVMVLDVALAEYQPIVHMQMRHGAGVSVCPDVVLESVNAAQRWVVDPQIPVCGGDLVKGTRTVGLHQQVEIGLAEQAGEQMLVALPMAEPNACLVETIEHAADVGKTRLGGFRPGLDQRRLSQSCMSPRP